MFGHYREKRNIKHKTIAEQKKKNKIMQNTAAKEKEIDSGSSVEEKAEQSKQARMKGREEGKTYAEDVLNRQYEGLGPKKRAAMQYEANKGIQRNVQSANRKLLGSQSQHGIVGKGGVGYAQQKDLQRMGIEAQAGVHRDLDKLDEDLAMKKAAQAFAIESGEATQSQLDRQLALDELAYENERKRQKMIEDKMYQQFSRV